VDERYNCLQTTECFHLPHPGRHPEPLRALRKFVIVIHACNLCIIWQIVFYIFKTKWFQWFCSNNQSIHVTAIVAYTLYHLWGRTGVSMAVFCLGGNCKSAILSMFVRLVPHLLPEQLQSLKSRSHLWVSVLGPSPVPCCILGHDSLWIYSSVFCYFFPLNQSGSIVGKDQEFWRADMVQWQRNDAYDIIIRCLYGWCMKAIKVNGTLWQWCT